MCVALAKALGKSEDEVRTVIAELESWAGWPSEDLRIISELAAKNNQRMSSIDLDPADTTAEELYGGLRAKYQQTQECFGQSIGINRQNQTLSAGSFSQILQHMEAGGVVAPRQPVLRKLISANPPKATLKLLGYRSLESLLKRENPAKIIALAEACESALWRRKFHIQRQKITPADYEHRPLKLFIMSNASAPRLVNARQPVVANMFTGVILAWPSVCSGPHQITNLLIRVLGITDQLSRLSLEIEFGAGRLAATDDFDSEFSLLQDSEAEASSDQSISNKLAMLHPAFSWWRYNEGLIFTDHAGRSVSLDILDMADDSAHGRSFNKRSLKFARQALTKKIYSRYQDYPGVLKRFTQTDAEHKKLTLHPSEKYRQLKAKYGHLSRDALEAT